MSLIPLVNPIKPFSLFPNLNPNPKISSLGLKKPSARWRRRGNSRVCCSNSPREPRSAEKELSILRPWNVPWDWKVTALVMMPYLMNIVFTGIVESSGLAGVQHPYSENMLPQLHSNDEAIKLFMDQLLKSVAKLSVLYMFLLPHQPLPDDIFSLKWRQPLDLHKGWIIWAGSGLIIASSAIFLLKLLISSLCAGQTQNETESLMRLLPLIGLSNVSTVCLLGVLGVLAPVCEETLYRGFLLTSLTKWFPLPLSVCLSSALFTLGHQSPGKFLEIFIFGIVLGFVYSRTRNLLAPIIMHACWNSGVILLLAYLQSQGHDIQKYVQ
ncbi:uncharacterized protein A4U43_C02F13610 [Asparagus officinalis]|uniref:CAAX prenyl protease 2/Lysostaphin resistance protein A-like domain-containing protein n=1 Tax=Asparagus officinalis TaxID=4686 RepID=A0A5P1FJZ6_ASPOF|nr:uncharacterized protein LOC109830769 isoform X2 [Asparagus officinalis]ONK78043.1 uncharacterized protein A4U43_C02F13610 [Asparagus officinalis]